MNSIPSMLVRHDWLDYQVARSSILHEPQLWISLKPVMYERYVLPSLLTCCSHWPLAPPEMQPQDFQPRPFLDFSATHHLSNPSSMISHSPSASATCHPGLNSQKRKVLLCFKVQIHTYPSSSNAIRRIFNSHTRRRTYNQNSHEKFGDHSPSDK